MKQLQMEMKGKMMEFRRRAGLVYYTDYNIYTTEILLGVVAAAAAAAVPATSPYEYQKAGWVRCLYVCLRLVGWCV